MSLAQRNDKVEELSAHSADQPFAVGVRLWGSHSRPQHLKSERLQLTIKFGREDRVAIMDQELLAVLARKAFTKLLPLCPCFLVVEERIMGRSRRPQAPIEYAVA